MAQYSQTITSSADLSAFTLETGSLTFETHLGVPCFLHSGSHNFLWDTPGTASDVDYYVRMATVGDDRASRYGGPAVRMASVAQDDDAYIAARGGSSGQITVIEMPLEIDLGNVSTALTTEWYWVRMYVQGSAIKVKVWTGALADEPGGLSSSTSWDIETTDSTISAAGYVGYAESDLAFASKDFWFSEFYVGTDGDLAPVGGGSGTTVDGAGGLHSISRQFTTQAAARLGGVLQ